MNRLEDLRQVTDNTLSGLTADDALKFRILQHVSEVSPPEIKRTFRMIPVLCSVLAVLLISVFSLNALQAVPSSGPGEMNSFTAGNIDPLFSSVLPAGFTPDTVVSVSLENAGTVSDPDRCAALVSLLIEQAYAEKSPDTDDGKKLTVTLENGQALLFDAESPFLTDNSGQCWYCPGFFREFESMINR